MPPPAENPSLSEVSDQAAVPDVVEAVVVNYNAGKALSRCVGSVFQQGHPVRVTVIDNASSDGSIESLRSRYGQREDLHVIVRDANPGFAAAVNDAVSPGENGLLLILNPDCEMRPESLTELMAALTADPRAALAGPKVVGAGGEVLRGTLRRFPDPWRSFLSFSGLWRLGKRWPAFRGVEVSGELPDRTTVAEAVSGACMLVRKAAFVSAGGMDGAYGLHCEDLDLMFRLRRNGYHCLIVPSARVFHGEGISSASRPLWVHWQKHRGMQRFYLKFQGRTTALPLRWLVVTGIWLRFAVTLPLLPFRG